MLKAKGKAGDDVVIELHSADMDLEKREREASEEMFEPNERWRRDILSIISTIWTGE